VESVVAELLRSQRAIGQPMRAFLILPEDAQLPLAFAAEGVDSGWIQRVPSHHRAYVRQARALLAAARAAGVRVLHSHGYHADVLTALIARRADCRHVATLHGFVGNTARGRLYEWMQLRALRTADAVIAVADTVRARAREGGIPEARLRVIRNPAPSGHPLPRDEARARLSVPPEARLVGWVGRMSAEKNPLAFLDVMGALPEVHGLMLGDGPLRDAVLAEVSRRGLGERVSAPGSVSGVGALMTAFDALVLTSLTEGTPMVALEAMRAGVPVASTGVGDVPALLGGGAGVVVDVGAWKALSAAVGSLLGEPGRASAVARAAHERVTTEYSTERWQKAHAGLYRALLA
jgi:glycosyltransferase involved in cell wall biosynthesis